ncbi:MAG: hypothetical protein ACTSQP_08665 [Promethearchaeota archaeon]
MSAPKGLIIFAGILTILGSFVFSWMNLGGGYVNGLGAVGRFTSFLSDLSLSGIINLLIVIIFLLSSIFIFIGIKSRALSIIGSILPIFIGLMWLLYYELGIISSTWFLNIIAIFSGDLIIIQDILPMYLEFGGFAVGPILLLFGGIFSFISGCMDR